MQRDDLLALLAGAAFTITAAFTTPFANVPPDALFYEAKSGDVLTFPHIGTPEYSASCSVMVAFEDHSAIAFCEEDGASYAFDPDGNGMAGLSYNAGWEWHPYPFSTDYRRVSPY